jgi:hypothetical protein
VTVVASSLFGQLDRSLHDHLGDLVRMARGADDHTAIDLARTELPKMVSALRALLGEHQPDTHGRCSTCRRRRFRRRLPAPCRAYLAAHLCLLIAEDDLDETCDRYVRGEVPRPRSSYAAVGNTGQHRLDPAT